MSKDSKIELRSRALAYLARREHSRIELIQKLDKHRDSEVTGSMLEELMNELEAENFLSDSRCADMLIRNAYAKGHGPIKLFQATRSKGIEQTRITASEEFIGADWFALAAKVREKRFGSDKPEDYRDKAKQARFLVGRGFNQEQIEFALSCVLDAE